MNKRKKKVLLVDGHALIHRAFHAMPELSTKDGQLVNAAYGFSLILLNSLTDLKPDYGAVAFDLAKPTFRHKEYKEYKGKRKKTPKELSKQIPLIKEIVQALNIPIFEQRGYEADDLVGSLAKQITKKHQDVQVIISTGDLDILQLVDDDISVYTMKRGLSEMIKYDQEKVIERYGFGPEKLVDYKGLKGDPSDNLPGVEGVGDKTAKQLIDKHGSLEEIYKDLNQGLVDLSDRLKKNLREQEEQARQSKNLATIRTDIDLEFSLDQMKLSSYDKNKVTKLFQKLEFKTLLSKLPQSDGEMKQESGKNSNNNDQTDYFLVENKKQLTNLIEEIEKKKLVAVDIETDTLEGKIIGVSFAHQPGQAYYLPLGEQFSLEDVENIMGNRKIKKVGHGLKYDYRLLLKNGLELSGLYFDTMIAGYLLSPERRNYQLDRLVFSEFGHKMTPLTDLMGEDHQTLLSEVDMEKVKDYSCEDSDYALRLFEVYRQELENKKLDELFYQIEMPLIKVLARMEILGVKVDRKRLTEIREKAVEDLKENKKEIIELAGEDFNLNSPLQIREILFDKLEIDSSSVRKTKTGLSTAASELEKIKDRHPIVELILKHRQIEKIRNTYIEPLLDRKKDRIQTNFNQVITATGRLSSSDPNLQNIPTRSKLGQEVRKAFVAQKGFKLVSLDYSQIELRIAAHLSGDKKMIEAFKSNQDIHKTTAAELFETTIEDVSKKQRDQAKTVNFAVLYGMSPYGLSQSLGESREYAKNFINNYFETFSGVKKYLDKIVKDARSKGYVSTILGRRRYFNLKSDRKERQLERAAINTPIQGSAADLIKKSMIEVEEKIGLAKSLEEKNKVRLLLQVHDELIFELPDKEMVEITEQIKNIMENVIELKVPLVVDRKKGPSWGEMEVWDE